MRAVIFSWEYPPRIVGKLADYINTLAAQIARAGAGTHVVTYHDSMTGTVKEPSGVEVTRVANPVQTHISLLTWALTLNQEVERAAANIYYHNSKHIDVIDVHDWHFIPAAVTLKNALGIPFVYSVDSLEDHRSPGANLPFNMAIRGVEWLGFFEAAEITAKSVWMQSEIVRLYKVPQDKIKVIVPNPSQSSWVNGILDVYKVASEARPQP